MISTANDPIVGIDLGTTNSLVAYMQNGQPEVLRSRGGERLIPSVISLVDGRWSVGMEARKRRITHADTTVLSVKRLLGRGLEDLEQLRGALPYAIDTDRPDAPGVMRVRLGSQSLTAVEISAMILREVKATAESALGQSVHRCVITVPAYFNDAQRQATRTAGRLAGFDVLRMINEPTAAALAYGLNLKKQGLVAVYDLGGGTFDVSILRLQDGIFEVLATHGNTQLGGDDLDLALARLAAKEIEARFGIRVFDEVELKAALLDACEQVKIVLSGVEQAQLVLDLPGDRQYFRTFNRPEFEQLALPLLESTRLSCEQALRDAGIGASQLSDVILVGGPTRLRVVRDVAQSIFGRAPNCSLNPDEVVAQGAAIQADILAGKNQDLLLLDVVPLSLGIETYGGLTSVLIPRNSKIPTSATEVYTTYVDHQTGVDIHVLQGEREKVAENRSLARFKLAGLVPGPAGLPRIEVTFLVDADGVLQVTALDQKTGKNQIIEVKPSFGLTDEQIAQMLRDSQAKHEDDILFKRLTEARLEGQAVLTACEKMLALRKEQLNALDRIHLEAAMSRLKTCFHGQSVEEIRAAIFALDEASRPLAEL